jgi:hypothetical protein
MTELRATERKLCLAGVEDIGSRKIIRPAISCPDDRDIPAARLEESRFDMGSAD